MTQWHYWAGLSRQQLHHAVMARNAERSTKGRMRQALKKHLAIGAAKALHKHNSPDRHDWLVRHMERQDGRCAYCGIPMFLAARRGKADRQATLDHVVPLARNGPDTEANTVAACQACNTAKADMNARAFRASPFCIARKAYADTLPDRPAATLTVTVRRRRRT
jgi:5-methylcytosine-specific restriction endonuclease McrA